MKSKLLVSAVLALCLTACGGNKTESNKDAAKDNAASSTRTGNGDSINNVGGAQGDGQSATTMGTGAAGTDTTGLATSSRSSNSINGTSTPTNPPSSTSGHHRKRSTR